jgi:hypothetical protein
MVVRHPVDERVLQWLEHKTQLFREAIDDVADEYKVPRKEEARVSGTFIPANNMPVPFSETQEQRTSRVAADRAQRAAQEAQARATRQIVQVIAREREAAKEAQMRHQARSMAPFLNTSLKFYTPTYKHNPAIEPDRLRDALAHMLSRCDGARQKDDVGFNATDATVARYMVYLDIEGTPLHAEALGRLLYKYKRQLQAVIPELYDGGQHGGGHTAHRV